MRKILALFALLMAILPATAQKNELNCFIRDPQEGSLTNIRNAPKGKIVYKADALDPIQLTAIVQPGGWWKIKGAELMQYGDIIKINSKEAWIHYSVLALGTENSDGQPRILLTEPRKGAKPAGTIKQHNAMIRPLELSEDGLWVKAKWEDITGWIEVKYTRDDCMEPGDGFPFAIETAYTRPGKAVTLESGPGTGVRTMTLKEKSTYEITIAHPSKGWWQLVGGSLWKDGEDEVWLDAESWIKAEDVWLNVKDMNKKKEVPLLERPDEKARKVKTLKEGTLLHPVDLTEDAMWLKVYPDGSPSTIGWIHRFSICWDPNGDCYNF